ncbi:MAG TPA: PepSY-like domain-containing protein [Candidatus Butyricimonas faecavium]|nr:PepSY-like domain-containing protein [Candidatus Butyricimonas faecavium]
MKKIVFLLVCLFSMTIVKADNDKPIEVNQLPAKAQTFITTYFKDQKVALVTQETGLFYKSYDVVFANGEKLEFDKSGNWTEVKCKTEVPAAIIPEAILKYVKANYPEAKILSIEHDSEGYEIKLSNRLEIKFNNKFQVVDIDD